MADPRFFVNAGPLTLGRLAGVSGVEVPNGADPERSFADVAPLDTAGPEQVSFLDNPKYLDTFRHSRAGACLVRPAQADKAPAGMVALLSEDPYRAYAKVAAAFYPDTVSDRAVADSAVVAESAVVGTDCIIGPGAVIGERVEIRAGTVIGANCVIGDGVVVGASCRIGANVTLACCLVGDRVILHPGVRIGQDGFGFALGPGGHLKVPQLGRVIVGNDVEVGANTTIDRGTGPDTVIGDGVKIDNLVQIGHNVVIGPGCIVVAQVGISGSTKVGAMVMLGGQTGIAGHLTIGDGVRIAAKSGVFRDIAPGTTVSGSPALPAKEFWRQVAVLSKLAKSKDV